MKKEKIEGEIDEKYGDFLISLISFFLLHLFAQSSMI